MSRIRMRFQLNERGQSIVILALFFLFAFLAFAALSVDGTIIYLRRRQLQNIADAAALAAATQLSQNRDETAAYQTAMASIEENGGRVEWYSTSDTPAPPNTNVGSGLDLVAGIEITGGCDVRVALRWSDIGTYFAQFFGRKSLQAGARAHAGCSRAGGLQPIAVKRFGDERDWNFELTNVNSAQIYCDECNTQKPLADPPPPQGKGNSTEFLRPVISDTITAWPPGQAMYEPPSNFADLASGKPGREYIILGNGVTPGVGTTSWSGLVNLDIRHVSAPPVEYYNGVDAGTNSNTLKDLAEYYIGHGYCCEIPIPGDQVAMYNGTSAAFSPQALQARYAVSDVIAVIVYNGHVFNTPNLAMTGDDPNYQATHPTTDTIASHVLTYSIHLEAENGFQSAAGGLSVDVEGLDGFVDWALTPADPVLGRNGIEEHWLNLAVTPKIATVGTTTHVITGTRMFYVSAIDDKEGGTDLRRYWAGIVTIGDEVDLVQRDLPAVTCTPTNSDQNYPFLSVVKGKQAKYQLDLDLWGVASSQDVTVSAGSLPVGFEWVNAPPWTRSTAWNKHPGAGLQIGLKVNDEAVASPPPYTPYEIQLTVSTAGMDPQTCELYVLVEEAGTTVKEYVEILGYAALQITGYFNNETPVNPGQTANAVRGRIVSELKSHPSQLTYGLQARLIPWGQ